MNVAKKLRRWWRNVREQFGPYRRLRIIRGDSLPSRIPPRDLILARDGDEDWCVGMHCPCGCGHILELLVVAEAKPRWDVAVDAQGRPTLTPSVWRLQGCRSHFWLRDG